MLLNIIKYHLSVQHSSYYYYISNTRKLRSYPTTYRLQYAQLL